MDMDDQPCSYSLSLQPSARDHSGRSVAHELMSSGAGDVRMA